MPTSETRPPRKTNQWPYCGCQIAVNGFSHVSKSRSQRERGREFDSHSPIFIPDVEGNTLWKWVLNLNLEMYFVNPQGERVTQSKSTDGRNPDEFLHPVVSTNKDLGETIEVVISDLDENGQLAIPPGEIGAEPHQYPPNQIVVTMKRGQAAPGSYFYYEKDARPLVATLLTNGEIDASGKMVIYDATLSMSPTAQLQTALSAASSSFTSTPVSVFGISLRDIKNEKLTYTDAFLLVTNRPVATTAIASRFQNDKPEAIRKRLVEIAKDLSDDVKKISEDVLKRDPALLDELIAKIELVDGTVEDVPSEMRHLTKHIDDAENPYELEWGNSFEQYELDDDLAALLAANKSLTSESAEYRYCEKRLKPIAESIGANRARSLLRTIVDKQSNKTYTFFSHCISSAICYADRVPEDVPKSQLACTQ